VQGHNDFASVLGWIDSPKGRAEVYDLKELGAEGADLGTLPYSIRVLVENALRHSGRVDGANEAVHRLLEWPKSVNSGLPFMPYRVLLQDYTGVPLIVDLAAMRDAMKRNGGDPKRGQLRRPHGPDHRPLGPGRWLGGRGRVQL
jgi:aconitate hydratase